MSWADPVIATALAILAEREAATDRIPVDVAWNWSPRDAWLSRVTLSRAIAAQPPTRGPSIDRTVAPTAAPPP